MSAADEPETWHLIGLHGGLHAYAKLTSRDDDGRMRRSDGRNEWEPIYEDGVPTWFRVPREIAEEWTADEDEG